MSINLAPKGLHSTYNVLQSLTTLGIERDARNTLI